MPYRWRRWECCRFFFIFLFFVCLFCFCFCFCFCVGGWVWWVCVCVCVCVCFFLFFFFFQWDKPCTKLLHLLLFNIIWYWYIHKIMIHSKSIRCHYSKNEMIAVNQHNLVKLRRVAVRWRGGWNVYYLVDVNAPIALDTKSSSAVFKTSRV